MRNIALSLGRLTFGIIYSFIICDVSLDAPISNHIFYPLSLPGYFYLG